MDKKLTIYTIADSFAPNIGGMEKVAEYSAVELGKNHDSIIFAPKISGYEDKLPVKVFRVKSLPIKKPQYMLVLPHLDCKMKKFVKQYPPDVIHIHNLAPLSKWFLKYGKKHHIPTFLTLHGYVDNDVECGTKSKFIGKILKKYFFKTISYAKNLFTVSNGCQVYYKKYGYDVQILRNGIDELSRDEYFYNELKTKYNIQETDNILCFVNRIVGIKNVYLLIDSLKILKDSGFKFKALIAGDGQEKKNLEEKVKEYKLDDCVFFLGNIANRSQVASVYAIGNLHLFPSVKDNSSLSIGESASQNIATLGMENTSTTELIVDKENGFLSKNTAEDYAKKIMEIFENKEQLKQVGINANKTLYHSWKNYCEDVLALYENELNNTNK